MTESTLTGTRLCTVDGCGRPHQARGWCYGHYDRWKAGGDMDAPIRDHDPVTKRQWIKDASVSTINECIDWPWGLNNYGYGKVHVGSKARLVHVLVCEATHGPKPPGMEVAHSCGRRVCANPAHLRWATPKENNADKITHGTDSRGEEGPNAKLTWYAVHWIRSHYSGGQYTQYELAEMFGVSTPNINKSVNHKSWRCC